MSEPSASEHVIPADSEEAPAQGTRVPETEDETPFGLSRMPRGPRQGALVAQFVTKGEVSASLHRLVTVVGRQRGCHINLLSTKVGLLHCVIFNTPEGYVLRNLDRRFGTLVNGHRARESVLAEGDLLHIGPFRFVLHDDPGQGEPELVSVRRELDNTREDLTRQHDEQEQLDRSLGTRQGELEALGAELDQRREKLQAELDECEQREETLTYKESTLRDNAARVQEQDEQLEQGLAELRQQRETFDKEMADWTARKTDLDAQEKKLQLRAGQLDKKRETQQTLSGELQERATQLHEQQSRLHQEQAELAAELEQLNARQAEFKPRAAKLKAAEATLKKSREQFDQRQQQWTAESQQRDAELDALQQQLEDRATQLDLRLRDLDKRAAEIDEIEQRWLAIQQQTEAEVQEMRGLNERTLALQSGQTRQTREAVKQAEASASGAAAEREAFESFRQAELAGLETREHLLAEQSTRLADTEAVLAARQQQLHQREQAIKVLIESEGYRWAEEQLDEVVLDELASGRSEHDRLLEARLEILRDLKDALQGRAEPHDADGPPST